MTKTEFDGGISRLERMFNRNERLREGIRNDYFRSLFRVDSVVFGDAVEDVMETFKPFPAESFPCLATIKSAISRMTEGPEGGADQPHDTKELDYCQQCGNSGFYLEQDDQAHFCVCDKGKYRRAAWSVSGDNKREERVERALSMLPSSMGGPPVCGIQERNPAGFWELTEVEHGLWMANKRAELDKMLVRVEARLRKEGEGKRIVPPDSIKRLIEEKLSQVQASMFEKTGDEDEVPF
jgi:hypothetical protein